MLQEDNKSRIYCIFTDTQFTTLVQSSTKDLKPFYFLFVFHYEALHGHTPSTWDVQSLLMYVTFIFSSNSNQLFQTFSDTQ